MQLSYDFDWFFFSFKSEQSDDQSKRVQQFKISREILLVLLDSKNETFSRLKGLGTTFFRKREKNFRNLFIEPLSKALFFSKKLASILDVLYNGSTCNT